MTSKKDPVKPSKPFTRGKALFASAGGATALSVFLGLLMGFFLAVALANFLGVGPGG